MIVDEVQPAVLEEVSAAIRPVEDEEVIVRTEDEEESHFWKIVDVDLGIALCQSLEREEHQEEASLYSKVIPHGLYRIVYTFYRIRYTVYLSLIHI